MKPFYIPDVRLTHDAWFEITSYLKDTYRDTYYFVARK